MSRTGAAVARRRDMPALTILRAFLAWWVVAFHAAPLHPFGFDQHNPFLRSGAVRVDCFFVISGFILFSAYPSLLSRDNPGAMRSFFVARFARIYPLHLVMLCAFALLILSAHLSGIHLRSEASFTWRALLKQFLLLHGTVFPDEESWNYPSWSVSAETLAYVAAPVLFLSVSRLPDRALLPILLGYGLVLVGLTEEKVLTRFGMIPLRVLLEFGFGALMCRVMEQFYTPMLKVRAHALLLGLAAAVCFAFLDGHGLFFAAMLWMIGFLSLREGRHDGLLGRLEAVLLYFGETAFGVYICHAFVLTVWTGAVSHLHLGVFGQKVPAAVMLCLVIQAMAALLNHLIEVPARRAIRTALRDARRRPASVSAHPGPARDPASAGLPPGAEQAGEAAPSIA